MTEPSQQTNSVIRTARIIGVLSCVAGLAFLSKPAFISELTSLGDDELMVLGGLLLLNGVFDILLFPIFLLKGQEKNRKNKE